MRIFKRFIFSVLCAVAAFSAMAQGNTTLTPYSKYGYGMLGDNATSMQRSMGGVGYAMSGGRQINSMNPASYASIDSLTFLWDIGLGLTNLWSKEKDASAKSTGGGLDYITMQFPLGKYMGGSVGLVPYSSVGYSFGSEIEHGSDSRVGYGGINQLYAGVSARPFKNFSIGANFGYLFGTIVNDVYAYTSAGNTSLFERVMKIRDWNVNIGAQYSVAFKKKHKVTLGAVFTPGKTFRGDAWGVSYDINNDTKPQYTDTISLKGNNTMANTYGIGLSYTFDNRLMVETDFTYQDWASAKFAEIKNQEQTKFNNRWKMALGAQYQHNPRGNYLQRMTYRMGVYYNNDYIKIDENKLKEYGVSVGFGLPTPGSKTLINLGFEYKRRLTSPVRMVTEDYINITIGVNFNEMWFWQNKLK